MLEVAVPHACELTTCVKAFVAVPAHRFELAVAHAVRITIGDDQGLVDEGTDDVGDVLVLENAVIRAGGFGGGEVEAAGEHRQPAE